VFTRQPAPGRAGSGKPARHEIGGDTAAVTDQPSIPGTAPAAKPMGRYVGRLRASRAGRCLSDNF
jgi:hypothetical protein